MLNRIEYETSFTVSLDRCAVTGIEPGDGRVGTATVVTLYGRFLADAVDVTFPRERISATVLDAAEGWIRIRLNISPDSMTGPHVFHILTLRGVVKSDEFDVYFHVEPSSSDGRGKEKRSHFYDGGFDRGIGGDLL